MDPKNLISLLRWNPDKSYHAANQSFSSQTVTYSFSDFISVWKQMDGRQVGPISACIQGPHAYVTLTSHLRWDRAFNYQQTPAVGKDVVLILRNAHIFCHWRNYYVLSGCDPKCCLQWLSFSLKFLSGIAGLIFLDRNDCDNWHKTSGVMVQYCVGMF